MSDHDSKPAQPSDVDDVVDHANAGLADAAAAASSVHDAPAAEGSAPSESATVPDAAPAAETAAVETAPSAVEAAETASTEQAPAADAAAAETAERRPRPTVEDDPDLAAFAEAEASFPGTFGGGTFTPPPAPPAAPVAPAPAPETAATTAFPAAETTVLPADDDATSVLAAGGLATAAVPGQKLPIFVQAPEAPREKGNRAAVFGIGLLAALSFAVLYLGIGLGIGLLTGSVTGATIVDDLLTTVRSASLWVPVAVFFLAFWLLGVIINRGRWGYWVVFGLIVGIAAYAGHVLGAVGATTFWTMAPSDISALVQSQALAPLAIAALVLGRELTIWFGAWAARSGARKTLQNAEAQREYERVLEAGPQVP